MPTLRVGMQFVTLCVTQRFCDGLRLKVTFAPPERTASGGVEILVGVSLLTKTLVQTPYSWRLYRTVLRITQRFCDVSWICLRLKAPFRPSATYFDGAKVGKAPGSVSRPTSSGSFALTLIREAPQRAILGPVRLARRPASHPPDQRQGSAVTYVAICVVSAIVVEKHIKSI